MDIFFKIVVLASANFLFSHLLPDKKNTWHGLLLRACALTLGDRKFRELHNRIDCISGLYAHYSPRVLLNTDCSSATVCTLFASRVSQHWLLWYNCMHITDLTCLSTLTALIQLHAHYSPRVFLNTDCSIYLYAHYWPRMFLNTDCFDHVLWWTVCTLQLSKLDRTHITFQYLEG